MGKSICEHWKKSPTWNPRTTIACKCGGPDLTFARQAVRIGRDRYMTSANFSPAGCHCHPSRIAEWPPNLGKHNTTNRE
jgi:hypothetical protein